MKYTKQELIAAFCEARGCTADEFPEVETQIQTFLDRRRATLEAQLAELPKQAKKQIKNIALQHLNKKAAEAVVKENETVNL